MKDGGRALARGNWPNWWAWELELSSHLLKRMQDRRFTQVDLRGMRERGKAIRPDVAPGRWVVETRFRRGDWEVIVEPDEETERLVVVTAYQAE